MVDVTDIISDAAAVARGKKHGKAGMAWRGLKNAKRKKAKQPNRAEQAKSNIAKAKAQEASSPATRKGSPYHLRKLQLDPAFNSQRVTADKAKPAIKDPRNEKRSMATTKSKAKKPKRTKRNK